MLFADLHTHPSLRPYQNRITQDAIMPRNPNELSSAWNVYSIPRLTLSAFFGTVAGFTSYSQADLTKSYLNDAQLICCSLYAVESEFFMVPDGKLITLVRRLLNLDKERAEASIGYQISGFNTEWIKFIKSAEYDYFADLIRQYKFITANVPLTPEAAQCTGTVYSNIVNAEYTVLANGTDMQPFDQDTVQMVTCIEGGNSLWSNFLDADGKIWNGRVMKKNINTNALNNYKPLNVPDYRNAITAALINNTPEQLNEIIPNEVCAQVMNNVNTLINNRALIPVKPFYVTIAHHYYNGMCGHCNSLQPLTSMKLTDQSFGMNTEITNLGYRVINELLKNKILIDVKHMSWKARQSYYRFRENNYPSIPVLWSHAGVSGLKAASDTAYISNDPSNPFYANDINLLDDDIYAVAKSGGLIGIELDKRVTGVGADATPEKLWLNIKYIAELPAQVIKNGVSVWDIISFGTDFDGVINPIDDFKTYNSNENLYNYIFNKLTVYLSQPTPKLRPSDRITPLEIMQKIFFTNVRNFVAKYYKR